MQNETAEYKSSVEARLLGPKSLNTRYTYNGGLKTVKINSQRSISDLERSIKHELLNHKERVTSAWVELNSRLQSRETISVYCDCSVINERFHLGVCIVGLGVCRLYGASLVTQYPQYTILGELHALRFAIACTRDFVVTNDMSNVNCVCMFSDVDHIEQLLCTNSIRVHESIRKSVRRLRRTLKRFNRHNPGLTMTVRYVGNPEERILYYRGAHRVARRMAGVRR